MTTRTLQLAGDLLLPIDTVTQTVAIVAKRRVGKSYTMRRLTEQLLRAKQQVIIVDPKGDQWGIRYAADGKGPGYPVVILGGERGDVELDVHAGEAVAKLAVEQQVSLLLDLSLLRKREVPVFMAEFLETLYRLKAKEVFRTPVMVVVDEADAVAPQKPQPGEERMLGAIEDIVRRGGQRGIGCILVTQRTAVLNKNVLTQAQILVALRTIAPQDLKAMKEWIDVHGDEEQRRTLMASLPSLPVGDAWFWSPGWPTESGIFKRIHVLPITTYDSGRTPEAGESRTEPKDAATIDLEVVKKQFAATIEKSKADDPKELRRRIAALEEELASTKITLPTERQAVSTPVVTDEDRALLERVAEAGRLLSMNVPHDVEDLKRHFASELQRFADDLTGELRDRRDEFIQELKQTRFQDLVERLGRPDSGYWSAKGLQVVDSIPLTMRYETTVAGPSQRTRVDNATRADAGLTRAAERRILTALCQYPDGRSTRQVAILTGYAMSGGGFRNALGKLRSLGYVDGGGDQLRATPAGRQALGPVQPLPTGRALAAHWLGQLERKAEREILTVLLKAYPGALTPDEIAKRTESRYEAAGGGFRNALGKLRTLELIEGRGELRASKELIG